MEAVLLVACTSTVAVFTDRLVTVIRAFMFIRTIVIGVATRTIRLEGRILPDDYRRVVLVTVSTCQVAAVVQRFERGCCVTEIVRHE